jgi:hypothetical protein
MRMKDLIIIEIIMVLGTIAILAIIEAIINTKGTTISIKTTIIIMSIKEKIIGIVIDQKMNGNL